MNELVMNITVPAEVRGIIEKLEASGYEAYIVGGCVRDCLRGETPEDWDICTSALPEQTKQVFAGYSIVETGLKHGTVTVVLNHKPFEITTYRSDGVYSDNRHPNSVEFLDNIRGDLSRRDFTINAMAYNPKTGLVDFFNGAEDLKRGILKCVGDPDIRFQEDALRILRALRFASSLGMSVEEKTAKAMADNKILLKKISAERIAVELNKVIVGTSVRDVFTKHAPIILEVIPELIPTIGFEQNSPYHCYDVFTHTLVGIEAAAKDLVVRLALLFHDIAKPDCYSQEDGVTRCFGHPQISSDIAGKILSRLKYDNDTIKAVEKLVSYHDSEILPERKSVKRWLNKIGEERLRQLIEVKKADAIAQSELYRQDKPDNLTEVLALLEEIIEQQQFYSLKDLAVAGKELIEAGVPQGPQVGRILKELVNMVINEQVENNKEDLMRLVSQMVKEGVVKTQK